MTGFTPQSYAGRGYGFTQSGTACLGDQRARRDPRWVTEVGENGMSTGRIFSVRHPRQYMRMVKGKWQTVRP